jgi:NADH:ubiquinone oxidoreductase subunit 6 (subunit J)
MLKTIFNFVKIRIENHFAPLNWFMVWYRFNTLGVILAGLLRRFWKNNSEYIIAFIDDLLSKIIQIMDNILDLINLSTIIFLSWDSVSNLAYITFSLIVLMSSLNMILCKNPIHSIFSLILVFLVVGFFLLMLRVEFMAFLLIIVYLGAIAVLFLFIIMMFNIYILESRDNLLRYLPLVLLMLFIIWNMSEVFSSNIILEKYKIEDFNEIVYNYKDWSSLLYMKDSVIIINIIYTYYFYEFIIASIILLVAMIGAIILTLNNTLNLKKQIYYKQNAKNAYNSLLLKRKDSIAHKNIWEFSESRKLIKSNLWKIPPWRRKKRKNYLKKK